MGPRVVAFDLELNRSEQRLLSALTAPFIPNTAISTSRDGGCVFVADGAGNLSCFDFIC
jgi:hypothetical protein